MNGDLFTLTWERDDNWDWYIDCPCYGNIQLASVEHVTDSDEWLGEIMNPIREYRVYLGTDVAEAKAQTLARLREILQERGQVW